MYSSLVKPLYSPTTTAYNVVDVPNNASASDPLVESKPPQPHSAQKEQKLEGSLHIDNNIVGVYIKLSNVYGRNTIRELSATKGVSAARSEQDDRSEQEEVGCDARKGSKEKNR
ncbi:hypothetical protein BGZ76_006339 [Entomortierella beljakovae]|nr:hypothetical protein BGZ76_006339 [Entomortierella beljakovae]